MPRELPGRAVNLQPFGAGSFEHLLEFSRYVVGGHGGCNTRARDETPADPAVESERSNSIHLGSLGESSQFPVCLSITDGDGLRDIYWLRDKPGRKLTGAK